MLSITESISILSGIFLIYWGYNPTLFVWTKKQKIAYDGFAILLADIYEETGYDLDSTMDILETYYAYSYTEREIIEKLIRLGVYRRPYYSHLN